MELNIKPMCYDEAKQISKWVYDEPFSIYSMDESDDSINELLNGYYFSVSDSDNKLIGYYCFGESAQVPSGNQYGVYDFRDITDVGLGIKPNLCSQGLGFYFFSNGLDYARNKFSATKFRLTVASFNERAIKVYERSGFIKVNSFKRILENEELEFLIMILC